MLGRIVEALAGQVRTALSGAAIWPGPPRQRSDSDPMEVAIWLYHISPDAVSHLPTHDPGRIFVAPRLTASLHYLLVVSGGRERDAHDAIGVLWKAMHHHALLGGEETGSTGVDLAIETLDIVTLASLWSTLAPLPMRPSVAVTARGVEP